MQILYYFYCEGTGKSLSMICGALKWLEDHQKRINESEKSTSVSINSEVKKNFLFKIILDIVKNKINLVIKI